MAREPGLFLRAYDLLLGAGWDPAQEGAVHGRKLAKEMERMLKERKVVTQAGLHRLLRREVPQESLLANLLLVGFNATHWPLWDLLRAAVSAAEEATLGFLAPRAFGAEADQLWIGSWEEETGTAADFPAGEKDESAEPFAAWVSSYERGAAPGRPGTALLSWPPATSATRSGPSSFRRSPICATNRAGG